MHVAISWDISSSGERWTEINNRMKEAIQPYSWARPLSTFYVVQLNKNTDRQTIHTELLKVAKSEPESIHFVVSPVMSSGKYNGYLPEDMWAKINKRTD